MCGGEKEEGYGFLGLGYEIKEIIYRVNYDVDLFVSIIAFSS